MTHVPSASRHDEYVDYPEGSYHDGTYADEGHHGTFAEEMGYTPTHGGHDTGEPPIHIARSASSVSDGQRERGIGTARTQTAKSMGVTRSVSNSGYGKTYPVR